MNKTIKNILKNPEIKNIQNAIEAINDNSYLSHYKNYTVNSKSHNSPLTEYYFAENNEMKFLIYHDKEVDNYIVSFNQSDELNNFQIEEMIFSKDLNKNIKLVEMSMTDTRQFIHRIGNESIKVAHIDLLIEKSSMNDAFISTLSICINKSSLTLKQSFNGAFDIDLNKKNISVPLLNRLYELYSALNQNNPTSVSLEDMVYKGKKIPKAEADLLKIVHDIDLNTLKNYELLSLNGNLNKKKSAALLIRHSNMKNKLFGV